MDQNNGMFIPKVTVFDGSNFEDWQTRLIFALRKEGLENLIELSDDEKKFYTANEEDRKKDEYTTFRKNNNMAMCFIVERLSPRVLLRVKDCVTAYKMFSSSKALYKVASDIDKDALRREFYSLQFNDNGNMKLYIEKFENVAQKYRSVGGVLSYNE